SGRSAQRGWSAASVSRRAASFAWLRPASVAPTGQGRRAGMPYHTPLTFSVRLSTGFAVIHSRRVRASVARWPAGRVIGQCRYGTSDYGGTDVRDPGDDRRERGGQPAAAPHREGRRRGVLPDRLHRTQGGSGVRRVGGRQQALPRGELLTAPPREHRVPPAPP